MIAWVEIYISFTQADQSTKPKSLQKYYLYYLFNNSLSYWLVGTLNQLLNIDYWYIGLFDQKTWLLWYIVYLCG